MCSFSEFQNVIDFTSRVWESTYTLVEAIFLAQLILVFIRFQINLLDGKTSATVHLYDSTLQQIPAIYL